MCAGHHTGKIRNIYFKTKPIFDIKYFFKIFVTKYLQPNILNEIFATKIFVNEIFTSKDFFRNKDF